MADAHGGSTAGESVPGNQGPPVTLKGDISTLIMTDIRGCIFIIGAALCLAFGVNFISPSGIALFGQWDKDAGVIMAGSGRADQVRAEELNNPLKVLRLIQEGNTILVDVRRADIYDQGHIPGALSFPLHEFDDILRKFQNQIHKDDSVLVYCSGVTCVDSHDFAARLIQMGYSAVTVYAGGFTEWEEMEVEVETNES